MPKPHALRAALAALAALLAVALLVPRPVAASPWRGQDTFAHPAFAAQWARADDPAARGGRSWTWGPGPWFDSSEFFREGDRGLRLVQYFDKGRMELGAQGVTNGLLVVELVSGSQQSGLAPDDSFGRGPDFSPVAGDPSEANPDAPSYFSFQSVSTLPGRERRDSDRSGQPVGATLSAAGVVGANDELARAYAAQTRVARYLPETGHNIPEVFWRFLTAEGPVLDGGRARRGLVIDWLAVMGYPISDAYWVRTLVGGAPRDVLVQLFERRVLTFSPDNQPAFQVEQANVGQHYFAWRYPQLGRPWAGAAGDLPIIFTSGPSGGTGPWSLASIRADGGGLAVLAEFEDHLPAAGSQRRVYAGAEGHVLIDTPLSDGRHRQLYAIPLTGQGESVRLTYTDLTPPFPYSPYLPVTAPSNAMSPASSPDGSKIAFVSDRTGRPQLFLMGYRLTGVGAVGEPAQLTGDMCDYADPAWAPDGRSLFWAARCEGDWELYRGELAYTEDSLIYAGRYYQHNVKATLVDVARLTNNDRDDRGPRLSPDGSLIAFTASAGGQEQVVVIGANGAGERALLAGRSPAWSPDGTALAFAANPGGDWEIYRLELASSAITQLTNNDVEDQLPIWGS